MSSSCRLCLLTIVGLLLPARGQTLEETTSFPTMDSNTMDIHNLTQVPDTDDLELQSTLQIPTKEAGGTTLSKRPAPSKDTRKDPQPRKPAGPVEDMDDPFFYDEDTLRKQGLLVAAVLFITGIVILTSGKCRHWSQLCRNYRR